MNFRQSRSSSPWKDWKLASSWWGRIGPLLGPMCPHVGAKTDLSSHPLCFDWAYKPGGAGRGSGGERRRIGRGKGQRWKWKDKTKGHEIKNGYNKYWENIKMRNKAGVFERSKAKQMQTGEWKLRGSKQEMQNKEKRKRVILWFGC